MFRFRLYVVATFVKTSSFRTGKTFFEQMPGRLYNYGYGSAAVAIFNFFPRFGAGGFFDDNVIGPGMFVFVGYGHNGVIGTFSGVA